MRNRVLLAAGTLAAFVPTLLFAQQGPMAGTAHREGSWELSAGVGGLVIGKAPTGKSAAFAPGGVLRVGYNINQSWNVSVGSYGGYGTSWTPGTGNTAYLSPFAAVTWTPDINQVTSPFVTAGGGLFWRKSASQSNAAGHVGVGVRHMIQDNLAVRGEVGLEVFTFKPSAGTSETSGAGFVSVGLSYFMAKKVVTSVDVTPAIATLTSIGQSQQLAAVAKDQHGNPMTGQAFTWHSSDPAVTVSPTGLVTAAQNGSATITAATATGVSGSVTVTVEQAAATVAVSPASPVLNALGATQQLSASAQDANNNPVANPSFSWTSSDPSVATVNGSGMVTAVGNGTAQIAAAANGQSGSASVTVTQATASIAVTPPNSMLSAAGATAQFAAQAMDANGRPIEGKTFTWASDASGVATVNESGMATAVANGVAHITASADGQSGTGVVSVVVAPKGAPPMALPSVDSSMVIRSVTFGSGSAALSRAARTELDKLAIAIRGVPDSKWEVGGYTNSIGSAASNQRLSQRRANAVRTYLLSKGVSASSLTAVGYGEQHPIASNRTAAGRRANIRVEIKRLQ
jgi:outer membrane protein OmpA-like peptidoglycan-associated protein